MSDENNGVEQYASEGVPVVVVVLLIIAVLLAGATAVYYAHEDGRAKWESSNEMTKKQLDNQLAIEHLRLELLMKLEKDCVDRDHLPGLFNGNITCTAVK